MPNHPGLPPLPGGPQTHPPMMRRLLAAWLYWNAKSGASGVVQLPTGENIDLSETPARYSDFVKTWRIHTAVAAP